MEEALLDLEKDSYTQIAYFCSNLLNDLEFAYKNSHQKMPQKVYRPLIKTNKYFSLASKAFPKGNLTEKEQDKLGQFILKIQQQAELLK